VIARLEAGNCPPWLRQRPAIRGAVERDGR
jgi:hypothetical protein